MADESKTRAVRIDVEMPGERVPSFIEALGVTPTDENVAKYNAILARCRELERPLWIEPIIGKGVDKFVLVTEPFSDAERWEITRYWEQEAARHIASTTALTDLRDPEEPST